MENVPEIMGEYFREHASDLFCILGDSGDFLYANRAWERLGYSTDELVGSNIGDLKLRSSAGYFDLQHDMAESSVRRKLYLTDEIENQEKCFDWSFEIYRSMIMANGREVDDQCDARVGLMDAKSKLKAIAETSPDGIIIVDEYFNIKMFNQAAEALFEYSSSEILDKNVDMLLMPPLHFFNGTVLREQRTARELVGRRKNGTTFPIEMAVGETLQRGKITYVGFIRDITEIKKYQEQLRELAFQDPVTGLSNRRLFEHDLELAFKKSERANQTIYVVFIDINNFKKINDSYGHDVGDEILCIVASRLRKSFRSADVVSRLGGDEFVVLVTEGHSMSVIKRLKTSLEMPMTVGKITLNVLFGIGYSSYPENQASDFRDLIRQADAAMYQSKRLGKEQNETVIISYSEASGG